MTFFFLICSHLLTGRQVVLSYLQTSSSFFIPGMATQPPPTDEQPPKGPTHKQLMLERQRKAQGADDDVKKLPSDFKRYPNVRHFLNIFLLIAPQKVSA